MIDSHVHAWRQWPYDQAVPDPATRGGIDHLLYEMDRHEVERALVVCARIGGNDDNNEYVARAAARHRDRLEVIVDVDCCWRPEYHTPGAAERLRRIAEHCDARGFTHYVRPENDGWFISDDGLEFFETAARHGLVASLAVPPGWQADVRTVAAANPTMPILLHHLGLAETSSPTYDDDLAEVVKSAERPNVFVKVSGFHYVSGRGWDFPFADARASLRRLARAYGTDRLCWGSDFPASTHFVTYTQALEVVRTYCDFFSEEEMTGVLGANVACILDRTV
ncbi:MAG TPA: amidohydrolase family protein [Actinopolymorphaceae bacterium]